MSKQISRLIRQYPQIIQSVSYEGDDGIWLYMNPGWYCQRTDCGTIHEYTIKEVLQAFKQRKWDGKRWIDENPIGNTKEIKNIKLGKYNQ